MNSRGFRNLYWGFLFVMIDFRIQGFDILPDPLGYLLFAAGFSTLITYSTYFSKARSFNIPMIILSIFSIYERPVQGGGVQFGPLGPLGVLIGIVSIVLSLIVVYYLFMGIKEMAEQREHPYIAIEAGDRWNQYVYLQVAVIFAFILIFIPPLAIIYIFALIIASIVLTVRIMGFLKRCEERL